MEGQEWEIGVARKEGRVRDDPSEERVKFLSSDHAYVSFLPAHASLRTSLSRLQMGLPCSCGEMGVEVIASVEFDEPGVSRNDDGVGERDDVHERAEDSMAPGVHAPPPGPSAAACGLNAGSRE
jgi:hypothetical protein